jgi:hypothetical protein
MPNKNKQLEILSLDPQGFSDVLDGVVEMLQEVTGTADFLFRGMRRVTEFCMKPCVTAAACAPWPWSGWNWI